MPEAIVCPQCGQAVAADAPQGLCAACLLQLALQSEASEQDTLPPTSPGAQEAATLPPRPSRPREETVAPPEASSTTEPTSAAPRATAMVVQVPGYDILSELGRGGMGVVYKARQVKANRLVALKMILAGGHAGAAELARFRTEAEAIARLQHPNIVQVFEVGEHDGKPFFSLEFCEGGSLAEKINGTPLPPKEAAQIIETLARAMAAAHERGVVHRDLKPANVLLASGGREPPDWAAPSGGSRPPLAESLKITDFGLAKKLDEAGQTATGAVMGTPSYMAPEQASGKGKEVGPAADIYALGAILYELLTGRPPFKAATPLDTVLQVVSDDPVPPRQLQSKTPRDLETICLKCLHKEADRRYSTAAVLADDLLRFREDRPILARPVGRIGRAWRWCKRHPAESALWATLAMVLTIGLCVSTILWLAADNQRIIAEMNIREKEGMLGIVKISERIAKGNEKKAIEARRDAELKKQDADDARALADTEKSKAQKQLLRAEWLVYASKINLAQREWHENKAGTARDLLDACRWDFRGWEHRYLWTLLQNKRGPLNFEGHAEAVSGVAFSPDGKRIASADGDHTVKVWDAITGRDVLILKGHTSPALCVAWSHDGKHIVSGCEGTVNAQGQRTPGESKIWDATTGRNILTHHGHTHAVSSVAFSPDDKHVVSGSWDKTLRIWQAADGKHLLTLKGHTEGVTGVALSRDGKLILSASGDTTLKIWEAATGRDTLTLTGHTEFVVGAAFSADGKRIVSASGDHTVKVWDAVTGRNLRTLKGHAGQVSCVAFSPDGQRIVSGGGDNSLKVWQTETGQDLLTLKGHTLPVNSVAFSPDGHRIISGSRDRTLKIWDAALSQETFILNVNTVGAVVGVSGVAFSSDGKRFVCASADRTLKVYDAATGQDLLDVQGHTHEVYSGGFSPDGQRIVSASHDKTVKVWDAATGDVVFTLKGHTKPVASADFSPDGKHIVSGSWDQTLKIWDAVAGKHSFTLKGHTADVTRVAFSHDGKFIVSGSDDRTAKVWDAVTGQNILTLKGHLQGVSGVAFSADGKHIVSGSGDGTLKVWQVATGRDLLTLKGHTDGVFSVAFSPDGKRIVSGSGDNTVKVWDAATGQNTLTLTGHASHVNAVAWSPDGRRLVSASSNGRVKVWRLPPEAGQGPVPER